jgi:hypothetical protein
MDWRKLLKRLKAAGLDPETIDSIKAAKTVGEVENILAAEMIELGQGVDLAQAWTTKKVTITADAGEDVEVITEPDGELAEDGEDDGDDDPMVGKAGQPRTRDLNKVDPRWAQGDGGASSGAQAVRGPSCSHTARRARVKAYDPARRRLASATRVTRKHDLCEAPASRQRSPEAFMRLVALGSTCRRCMGTRDYSGRSGPTIDIVGKAHSATDQALRRCSASRRSGTRPSVGEQAPSSARCVGRTGTCGRCPVHRTSDAKYPRLGDSDPVASRASGEGNSTNSPPRTQPDVQQRHGSSARPDTACAAIARVKQRAGLG